MKSLFITLIPFLFLSDFATAQIFEIKKGDKWGFINREGDIVVPPKYDYIYDDYTYSRQKEGYFVFQDKGKMGVFQSGFGERVPAAYEKIKVFSNLKGAGYFEITENELVGVMDTLGQVILKPAYQEVAQLLPGVFKYRVDNLWGIWDQEGLFRLSMEYDSIYSEIGQFVIARKEGFYYAWDRLGNQRYSQSPTPLGFLSNKVLVYQASDTTLYGLADSLGIPTTRPVFDSIKTIEEGFYQTYFGRKRGLVNDQGKIILDTLYYRIYIDPTRMVWMRGDRNLWGIMSAEGDTIAPLMFNSYSDFEGPVARVMHRDGWVVINQFGDILTEDAYSEIQILGPVIRYKTAQGWKSFSIDEEGRRLLKQKLIIRKATKKKTTAQTSQSRTRKRNFWEEDPTKYGWFLYRNRFGWRDTTSGEIRIEPVYSNVYIVPHLGISIVMIDSKNLKNRTVGLADHLKGKILTKPELNMIYIQDFENQKIARAQYGTGAFVLINARGQIRMLKKTGYIGPFKDDIAVANTGSNYAPLTKEIGEEPFRLKTNKGWGYMHINGTWMTKPEYRAARDYELGVGIVQVKNKWGVYDSNFNLVIPPQFDDIHISKKTNKNLPEGATPFLTTENHKKKYFFLDEVGNLRFSLELEEAGDVHEGIIKIQKDGKWGYIDTLGNMIADHKFERAGDFREGVARVRIGLRWGFIDRMGNYTINPQYMGAGDFVNGIAMVKDKARFGYIRQDGSWVIKPVYYRATDFHKGLAITRRKNDYGVINEQGTTVIPHRFDRLYREDDYFRVMKDGRIGFYDVSGQEISPPIYNHVGQFVEGRARVRIGSQYKFIDLNRRELPTEMFDWTINFQNGLAGVKKEGRWGVIDYQGNLVVDYRFGEIEVVGNRKIKAYKDGWKLVQTDTIPAEFTWVDPNTLPVYSDIFETVKGKFGYDEIHPPKEKTIVAYCKQLYGLANTKGDILYDTRFEKITFRDGLYKVVVDGNISYLNVAGEWVYPKE
ncbi:MAG: WG repeat-containing protein [Bacteroidia bacterium]